MLGQPSPRRMLDQMSVAELAGWQNFLTTFPRGEDLLRALFAKQTADLINAQRPKGKAAIHPEKFLLQVDDRPFDVVTRPDGSTRRRQLMTPEQMRNVVVGLNARFGGKDLRGPR